MTKALEKPGLLAPVSDVRNQSKIVYFQSKNKNLCKLFCYMYFQFKMKFPYFLYIFGLILLILSIGETLIRMDSIYGKNDEKDAFIHEIFIIQI